MTCPVLAFICAPLAWVPFIEPLVIRDGWLLLLPPIVFAVSLVYKTLKLPTLDRVYLEAGKLTAYILLMMVAAAAALWVLVETVEHL